LKRWPGFQNPGIGFSGKGKIYGIITKEPGNVKKLKAALQKEKISLLR